MSMGKPTAVEERTFEGIRYLRVADDTPVHPRGTVIFPEVLDEAGRPRTVWAFPRVKRIYVLARGVQRFFKDSPFFVEEKLDGYNVRLAYVADRILALTRGGFVCPYTTEWAELWAEQTGMRQFFHTHPEMVLCGEALGDSPYNPQTPDHLPPGLHFFLFDIATSARTFVPAEEKYLLAARFAIPTVPQLGRYDLSRLDELRDLLLEINRRGGEGVVMKSPASDRMVKFVTPLSDLADIRDHLCLFFDLDSGFFTNRLLRAALFVQEFDLDRETYAQAIGQAVLDGLTDPQVSQECVEEYHILVRNISTWHALRDVIDTRVPVEETYHRPVLVEGHPFIRVGFRRVYRKSTKRFRMLRKGYGHYD